MAEVAVALVNLGLVATGFALLLQVGVLLEAGIAGFTHNLVHANSQLFSGFQAGGGALNITLNGFKVILAGEATGGVSGGHNSGDNRFH
jgi:uncharacterized membrane-anchored protein YitT (DUF2179 family)